MIYWRHRSSIFVLLAFLLTNLLYFTLIRPLNPFFIATQTRVTDTIQHKQRSRYAYATFLGSPTIHGSSDPMQDPYFTSIRLLSYQILHAARTKTQLDPKPPFLILVLPTTPASQVAVLEKEGAEIVRIVPLNLPDAFDKESITKSRFRDVLAKLRLWQLTEYEKVLYLDADTILLSSLDAMFTDQELSNPMRTRPHNGTTAERINEEEEVHQDELPAQYLMRASADTYGHQSEWETPNHVQYLCACFMLLVPSTQLFEYYVRALQTQDALKGATYPEQDLLIWAHRAEGRMPWKRLPIHWSANDGNMAERLGGDLRSLHVKGWNGAEGGNVGGTRMREMWTKSVRDMEEYYENRK